GSGRGPAPSTPAATAPSHELFDVADLTEAARAAAKEVPKDIRRSPGVHVLEPARATPLKSLASGSAAASVGPDSAEAVVLGAFRLIGEHVVGFLYFLELALGLFVTGIAIGVEFARQLAVSFLDLLFGGALLDSQDFIIIAGHGEYLEYSQTSFGDSGFILDAWERQSQGFRRRGRLI